MSKMEIFFETISTICAAAIFLQLFLLKKQIALEHTKARREKALEVMFTWSNGIKKETSFADSIVESLDEEQCRKLCNRIPFCVSLETKQLLCQICSDRSEDSCMMCKDEGNSYLVSGLQLSELRWYVISYLNSLETVLLAWHESIVDRKIIEKEFKPLYNPQRGWNMLERFRIAAGGATSYPAISAFCEMIKNDSQPKPPAPYLSKDLSYTTMP